MEWDETLSKDGLMELDVGDLTNKVAEAQKARHIEQLIEKHQTDNDEVTEDELSRMREHFKAQTCEDILAELLLQVDLHAASQASASEELLFDDEVPLCIDMQNHIADGQCSNEIVNLLQEADEALIAACMGDGGIDMEISHRLRFKLGKVDGEKVMGVSLSEWTNDPNGWWMPAPAKVLEWIEFLKRDDTFDSNHQTWFYVLYSPNTNVMYGAVHTFATK